MIEPQFKTFEAFLAMGGHAGFVFGAWGLSVLVIVILAVSLTQKAHRQKKRLDTLERDLP